MRRKSLVTICIISIILVSLGFILAHFNSKNPPVFWRTVPVEKGDVTVLVTATGSMAADTSIDVGVEVTGIIAKIKVDFNDYVKKGQVIAILDTTLYYAAKLDAEATVQRAQVALDEAKVEYAMQKPLLSTNAISQVDYDKALSAYQTAQTNLVSAKAQLNRAIINLQYCTIKAPINGTVIARNVQVGNMVIASFNSPVLFTIANDLKRMQLQADVDEADIGLVKEGQRAKFTVDAYPNDVFTGVITQVRHQPIIVQNVVNYVVIIEVPNEDLKLIPGLTANANIFVEERKNVLKVPTNAFSFMPSGDYMKKTKQLPDSVKNFWIKKLQQIHELKKQQIMDANKMIGFIWVKNGVDIFPVQVSKGLNDGTFTEIQGKINEGDEVVTGVNHGTVATETQGSKSPFMPTFGATKK